MAASSNLIFTIDNQLVYEPLYGDNGPLSISKVYIYVKELIKLLDKNHQNDKKIIHWSSDDTGKRANAAFLMGAFMILVLKMPAEKAWKRFAKVQPSFADFRDAS